MGRRVVNRKYGFVAGINLRGSGFLLACDLVNLMIFKFCLRVEDSKRAVMLAVLGATAIVAAVATRAITPAPSFPGDTLRVQTWFLGLEVTLLGTQILRSIHHLSGLRRVNTAMFAHPVKTEGVDRSAVPDAAFTIRDVSKSHPTSIAKGESARTF